MDASIPSDRGTVDNFRILAHKLAETNKSDNTRRLPVELLQRIFVLCLGQWFHPLDYIIILCNICSVCGLWRAVALAMPSLWAHVTVEIVNAVERPKLPFVRLWLERSGNVPLSWSMAELGYKFNPNLVEVFLDLFAAHFRRSQIIFLMLQQEHFLHIDLLAGCAPMLEVVNIAVRPHSYRGDHLSVAESDTISRFLRSSSLLRTFHFQFGRAGLHSLDIPWTQLANIHIKASLAIDHVLHILSACTNLIGAHLEGILEESQSQLQIPSRSRISCPSLQSLGLVTLVDLTPLLEQLNLPSLLDVAIECNRRATLWPQVMISQLGPLISRSGACLQSLSLSQVPYSEDDIISIFHASPGLLRLEIQNNFGRDVVGVINDYILEMLTYKGTDMEPCLCPKLESITIGDCLDSSDGVFALMVASRYSQVDYGDGKKSLSSLRFVSVGPIGLRSHKRDVYQLRITQHEGFTLKLFVKHEEEDSIES